MDLCLVGYTYRNYPMEEAFRRASLFGYSLIEVRDFIDINLKTLEGIEDALKKALKMAEKYRVSPLIIFRAINIQRLSSTDEASFLEETETICKLCRNYGVKIWNTRINLIDGPKNFTEADKSHIDIVIKLLKKIASIIDKYNLTITIENHMGNIHDSLKGLIHILSAIESDRIKACFDFANFLIVNPSEDLIKAITSHSEFIGYTHIKNVKLYKDRYDWGIPIALGDIDYRRILGKLLEKYTGALGIEYCGTGDPVYFSEIDARYIRDIINEIERR